MPDELEFSQEQIDQILSGGTQPEPADPAGSPESELRAPPSPAASEEASQKVDPSVAQAAGQSIATAPDTALQPEAAARVLQLPNFQLGEAGADPLRAIELLQDVGLRVKIELGRSRMLVEDVLRLGDGSVVELDKLAGDPVDIYVNDRLLARGEVLVLNDNFCVRVNEIIGSGADFENT